MKLLSSRSIPAAPPGQMVKHLGQMAIPELADKRYVPYATLSLTIGHDRTLSLTIGHDRKLYYAAAEKEFDYGGSGEAERRLT